MRVDEGMRKTFRKRKINLKNGHQSSYYGFLIFIIYQNINVYTIQLIYQEK